MSGETPRGWREAKLGDLCRIEIGGTPSRDKPEFWSNKIDGHPWVSIADLKTTSVDCTKEFISDLGVAKSNVKPVPRGTVMMSFKLTIGRTAVAGCDLYTNEAIAAFFPERELENEFLFYALPHAVGRAEPDQAIKGATLNKAKLRDLTIVLPPLDEQRRIAELLRSVDEAISALRKTCDAYERLRKAEVESFANSHFEGEKRTLNSLISLMDSGWSPDCESEAATCEQWGSLKTTAVTWKGYDDRHNKRLPVELTPRPTLAVASDDILITRAGPADRTGVVAIVQSTCGLRMLSDKLIRVRARQDLFEPLALAELLKSDMVQAQINALKSGMAASQTNISQKSLSSLLIPLVPRNAQKEFVERMNSLDIALNAERDALVGLLSLKTSISKDLLSGRIRVPA